MSELPFKFDEHGNLVIRDACIQDAVIAQLRASKDLALVGRVKELENKVAIDNEQKARVRRDAEMSERSRRVEVSPMTTLVQARKWSCIGTATEIPSSPSRSGSPASMFPCQLTIPVTPWVSL